MPLRDRRDAGLRTVDRRPVDARSARVGAVGAEQQPRELGAARAEQAGQADDLALVDGKVERRDRALAPEPLRLERPAFDAGPACGVLRAALEGLERLELAAEHLRDELDRRELGRSAHSPTSRPLRSTVIRSAIS